MATPAAAIALSCACGGIVGAGSGLLKYDMSLSTILNGLSVTDMLSVATPKFIAGGVAGAVTMSLAPLIVHSFDLFISTPVLDSLASVTSQYFICQTTAVTVEGAIGDRWQGYGINEVAIDIGSNALLAMAMGSTLGMVADINSMVSMSGLANIAKTSTEIIVETVTETAEAGIIAGTNVKNIAIETKNERDHAAVAKKKYDKLGSN